MKSAPLTVSTALLLGLGGLLVGCGKPCERSAQCGGGEVCAAALCQKLSCDAPVLLRDPATGACTALSGCFLLAEQREWETCADDPCAALGEGACLSDRRCQPVYSNPDVQIREGALGEDKPAIACGSAGRAPEPIGPDGEQRAAGVHNGEAPKHPRPDTGSCQPDSSRAYAGCRPVPQITPRPACSSLSARDCATRPDCTDGRDGNQAGKDGPGPVLVPPAPQRDPGLPPGAVCFDRVQRAPQCEGADRVSCLLNPACQPIGARCFCPPGASCECQGGAFLGCERNDRLRRCQSANDCQAGERCDNDEACIAPRTFSGRASTLPEPVPGTGSCLGACVPMGCAGFGEQRCHERPECDGGVYGTVCRPKPYCSGGGMLPSDPADSEDPTGFSGSSCGCETEFKGCAPQAPDGAVRPERSLLVRDPAIVEDPAFRIDSVIRKLAPAGQEDAFVRTWLSRIGAQHTLPNGASAGRREGWSRFYGELAERGQLTAAGLAGLMHTTALVNRVDLATLGDCGEARITFALNSGYADGNRRMTAIVELKVPDDGAGCRKVAQRWAELSLIDDGAERLRRLRALYAELLTPERLGQIRTNEFLNLLGREAWELREWRLGPDGLPALAPVKQTVDPRFLAGADLQGWARQNLAALRAGTAQVPERFLAAVSTENGARLRIPAADPALREAETELNKLACAGCHLTETKSPFAHIGERLGRRASGFPGGYRPDGRAVIDEFMQKELKSRAANLRRILQAPVAAGLLPPWRSLIQARTH